LVNGLTSGFTADDILPLAMDVVGLTWERILAAAWDGLGATAPAAFLGFVDLFDTVVNQDLSQLWQWLQGLKLEDVLEPLQDAVVGFLPQVGVELAKWLAALIPGAGWVAALIKGAQSVLAVYKYLNDNPNVFQNLVSAANGVFQDLINSATFDVNTTGMKVKTALNAALAETIRLLAAFLHLQPLADEVQTVVGSVVGAVPRAVTAVVTTVAQPLVDKLGQQLPGQHVLFGPRKIKGNRQVWLTVAADGKTIEVWVSGSPGHKVEEKDYGDDKKGLATYRDLRAKGQDLKKELDAQAAAKVARPGQKVSASGKKRGRGQSMAGQKRAQKRVQKTKNAGQKTQTAAAALLAPACQGSLVPNASTPCDSLDPTQPDLRQREQVTTISVTILPVGTPTTPRNEIVVRQAVAWVRFEPTKGQVSQADAQNWVQNVVGRPQIVFHGIDQAGHVISRQLGGQGDLSKPLNIVPLHPMVNTGSYRKAEQIAEGAAMRGSCRVCVRVTFEYDQTSPYPGRPRLFTYEVWVDGNKVGNVRDQNILNP
jgi:hypothetical protein